MRTLSAKCLEIQSILPEPGKAQELQASAYLRRGEWGGGLTNGVDWKSEEQELLDHLQSFPLSTEKLLFRGNRHHIEKGGHVDRNQESSA